MDRINIVESLCKDEPKAVAQKIQAAYWAGCAEGMEVNDAMRVAQRAVKRVNGNVVYLKERASK